MIHMVCSREDIWKHHRGVPETGSGGRTGIVNLSLEHHPAGGALRQKEGKKKESKEKP